LNLTLCDCGSQKSYQACCQPYLSGEQDAKRPAHLMRSRYTAFCRKNIDYLIATHHPSQREPDDRVTLSQNVDQTEWLGLKILKADPPTPAQKAENQATVEFVAFFRSKIQSSSIEQLHEKSEFVHEDGRWYYLRGEMLEPIIIGRNESCWCGSGKKYKQCHGKAR